MTAKHTSNGKRRSSGLRMFKLLRKICVSTSNDQPGCLIIELLTMDDIYPSRYDGLTALVFPEQAECVLDELYAGKTMVYDPDDEALRRRLHALCPS